ncbi:MAG: nuclear transport factor 2 family protein [Porticoccaceae bacterium]
MTAKETVLNLYRAYASGDPGNISELLHPDVLWIAPPGNATQVALGLGRPDDAGEPNGSNNLNHDKIVNFMAYNFRRLFIDAKNEFTSIVSEENKVIVEHRLSALLPTGKRYVNDYCFYYEVLDGRIIKIREYMDTRGGWAQVFGNEEPITLLEFVSGSNA